MAQEIGRDALFREFFRREPTKDELQWFDRLESLMCIPKDDSLWFYVMMCEFYDERHKKRLQDIERVSEEAAKGAADKAIERIAGTVVKRADELATEKDLGFNWRSWALLMSPVVLLGAMTFSAGYVMGSGNYPFWVQPKNAIHVVLGWVLNAPAGWILLLACSPFIYEIYGKCVREIRDNRRFGQPVSRDTFILYAKIVACLGALGLLAIVMLYLTGLDFIYRRFLFFLD